jgi:hypothetical protein
MATINPQQDVLGTVQSQGFSTDWDWKGMYVQSLQGDGYERFSQYSASPDTTAIFGGPARFTALSGSPTALTPIGLSDGLSLTSDPQLAQLFELGSNRSFFTRGKTSNGLTLSRLLANQSNILNILTQSAYHLSPGNPDGASAPGAASPNPNIMMNLDSEYFAVPFGMLLLMKTRGGGASGSGSVLAAVYCEYCMFRNYQFGVSNGGPMVQEGVQIAFDRVVPVAMGS